MQYDISLLNTHPINIQEQGMWSSFTFYSYIKKQ